MNPDNVSELLWTPDADRLKNSSMTRFSKWLEQQTGECLPDYGRLHQWSIDYLKDFWKLYLEFSGIAVSGSSEPVVSSLTIPGAHWFQNLRLNYAENLLANESSAPAIHYQIEGRPLLSKASNRIGTMSFGTLRREVQRCAGALLASGIGPGDRVAGYVANVPEAIIAALGCAVIGATWSSASPDFGLDALCDRFSQVEPRIIFASEHYRYGGKTFSTGQIVRQLKGRLPSVRKVVSIPYPIGESHVIGDCNWEEFLGTGEGWELRFERFPFDHPLYILFSSGTTGAPKCMVHGTGGTLLQHHKELLLHCNLRPGARLLFFTTCGWMMWNWQLSALALGATICLYDGNPGFPDLYGIWNSVSDMRVSHFGTSGRFLESCMKARPAVEPSSLERWDELESLFYTGSPLSSAGYRWVYEAVKSDLHLAGISGGTDIVSCFVLGNPNLPVRAGEIQCRGLGVDVVAFDEKGEPVVGETGELVCRKPIPSMPVRFLNDEEGEKYRKAYFEVYPGVWCHGDYVRFTETGGVIIYGRSDATLNPGGVRIGSAEIYSALDSVAGLAGALVVGWISPGSTDEMIVLTVVLAGERELDDDLKRQIRATIRERCSPRHVPREIFEISSLPVTRSGKPVELSAKAVLAGRTVKNREALANPEVLDEFEEIRSHLNSKYVS